MGDLDDVRTRHGFATRAIHAGQDPDPTTGAVVTPISLSTTFAQDGVGGHKGFEYSRSGNPTRSALEAQIASLEDAAHGLAFASGLAAEDNVLRLLRPGQRILLGNDAYGGTFRLISKVWAPLGFPWAAVDLTDLDSLRANWPDDVGMVWLETPTNPLLTCFDIEAIAEIGRAKGAIVVVDNTFATPYLQQPLTLGAHVVVHSATKYLGGHGTAIAGVIVDSGNFDWTQGRHPGFTTPDPSYHGVVFAELGPPAFALKARVQLLRDLGSAAAPFNAFLISQGLETLSLRIERHVANAQRVAEFLSGHDGVVSVNYAGLPTSPWYEIGKKLAPKGTGAVLAFELAGGIEAGKAFVNALTLHSHVANIGDVRSLVIHPASTTHAQLSPEEQLATGVTPGLVRLAVGIEGIDDILADLEQGFVAAKPFAGVPRTAVSM
ncbi:MAG TPA: PLP-dependent transferase [Mycobacterium sp.]|nr:PLP-dependent transferase [Mycobacterium sp.]